jgi:hypothetical protein
LFVQDRNPPSTGKSKRAGGTKSDGDGDAYQNVATWTKHVDLFSKEFVLVPVNMQCVFVDFDIFLFISI